MTDNVTWTRGRVSRDDRQRLLGQSGCVLWLTGLSAAGKSTLAIALEERLVRLGRLAYVLVGDNLRHGLNQDLGFSPEARRENIRRVGEVAALMADAGVITITAFISPYRADRRLARAAAPPGRFLEVHVSTSVETCERRDPKGLYAKARAGLLPEFTGVSAPYEAPEQAELVLDTAANDLPSCLDRLVAALIAHGAIADDRTMPGRA